MLFNETTQDVAQAYIPASSADSQDSNISKSKDLPDWYLDCEKKLKTLLDLKAGWDGGNANSIAVGLERIVLDFLIDAPSFLNKPSLVPLLNGGIQLEWQYRGKNLEIELSPNKEISSVLVEDSRGFEKEFLNEDLRGVSLEGIKTFIQWLTW